MTLSRNWRLTLTETRSIIDIDLEDYY